MNMIYDPDSAPHLNIGEREREKNDVPNSPEPVLGVIHFFLRSSKCHNFGAFASGIKTKGHRSPLLLRTYEEEFRPTLCTQN